MNMPLVLLNRRRRGGSFSPYSLFSGTAIGTWFDPSDLTTMYQDAAGTTAVTTPGQPVGLRLDKSKGLALGAELVSNGDFSAGLTGWTNNSNGTGTAIVADGVLTLTRVDAANRGRVDQGFATVVGRTYKATCNLFNLTIQATTTNGGAGFASSSSNVLVFVATTTTTFITALGISGTTGTIDNISVRELAGNHATQSVLASRPVYGIEPAGGRRNLLTWSEGFDVTASWTASNAVVVANSATAPDGSITADLLRNTATNTAKRVTQTSLPSTVGTLTIYAKAAGETQISLWLVGASVGASFTLTGSGSTASLGATSSSITALADGWYRCAVYHSSASTTADIYLRTGSSFIGDGTSGVFLWGAQFETGSTATPYQRVTSAFDVTEAGVQSCHYVQYDGSDDGMITNSIDFTATDKMSVFAGVRKLSDAAEAMLLELNTTYDASTGAFALYAPGGISVARDSAFVWASKGTLKAFTGPAAASFPAPISNVVTGLGDISGDRATIRANGTQVAQSTADQGTGNYGNYKLNIGRRNNATLPFNGRDFGIIVVGKAASAGEITDTETWLAARTSGVSI